MKSTVDQFLYCMRFYLSKESYEINFNRLKELPEIYHEAFMFLFKYGIAIDQSLSACKALSNLPNELWYDLVYVIRSGKPFNGVKLEELKLENLN